MTLLLWKAQKCWEVTDVSIQVFCINFNPTLSGISRHLRCSTIVFHTFLDLDSAQCTVHAISDQLLCTSTHQDIHYALCNTLLSLCSTVYNCIALQYTQCNTPALVFRANRTIMPSLLDLRQLKLSTICWCKSALHLFKMNYSYSIFRQSLTKIGI